MDTLLICKVTGPAKAGAAMHAKTRKAAASGRLIDHA
jgi:hypothetical protein